MLRVLEVRNFAVIERAELAFDAGLTVLTGETGAGKSILVDALELLLGGRADPGCIRAGCEEATVEALFELGPALTQSLEAMGLSARGEELEVRRVIQRSRSRAYVNGTLVGAGSLGQLLRGAVDLAGQHDAVRLFDPAEHRVLLDRYGRHEPLLEAYAKAFEQLRHLKAQAERQPPEVLEARIADLREQVAELERLAVVPDEEARLEAERVKLAGAEKRRALLLEAQGLLEDDERAAVSLVSAAEQRIQGAAKLDAAFEAVATTLVLARQQLSEVARRVRHQLEQGDGDPGRLAEVEDRLQQLRRLARRLGTGVGDLPECSRRLSAQLAALEGEQRALQEISARQAQAQKLAGEHASRLTQARVRAAAEVSAQVTANLAALAMPFGELVAQVAPRDELCAHGADEVQLLFSANAGQPPRPLTKVASGGEASRLLLALKRVLSIAEERKLYVLDEADAGVSGAVAAAVGEMVREVSRHGQVICITHLPQVAAFADAHFKVEKQERAGASFATVRALSAPERVEELARLMSGRQVSPEALRAARALLRGSRQPIENGPVRRRQRLALPAGVT